LNNKNLWGVRMKIRRTYTRKFILKVLRECENGKGKAQLSREHCLHSSFITRWEKEFREDHERAFSRNGNIYKEDARIGELERVIGELYAKNSFDSPSFQLEVCQLILAVLLKYVGGTLECWKSQQRMFYNACIRIVDGLQNSCLLFKYLCLPHLNNTCSLNLDI